MRDYSHYKTLKVSTEAQVMTIALNRPEQLNAVSEGMHDELAEIFYDVSLDKDVKIIILTGTGKAFSAGGDLEWLDNFPEPGLNELVQGKRVVNGLLDCPKPVICRLNGDAMGLGASIALLCDIIVADEEARIADPHVKIGLVAGDGGAVIWPQLIGYARAKEFLLTGDAITAKDAVSMGLINHAVPAEELDERVQKIAKKILNNSYEAVCFTKMSVNIGLKRLVSGVLDTSLGLELLSQTKDDFREGVKAFRERRKPVFK